jgi:hypothetical protein
LHNIINVHLQAAALVQNTHPDEEPELQDNNKHLLMIEQINETPGQNEVIVEQIDEEEEEPITNQDKDVVSLNIPESPTLPPSALPKPNPDSGQPKRQIRTKSCIIL